jgi:RecA/RadA recombinase
MNNTIIEHNTKIDPNIGCHETHYAAIAHIQEAGGLCALIDLTNGLDVERAKEFGVNFDELLVSKADTAYEASMVVRTLIAGGVDLIEINTCKFVYDPEKEAAAKVESDKFHAELREHLLKRKEGEKQNVV